MIHVRRGDLARLPAEGILRPVSAEGDAVSGVGRQVERVAGQALASRLRELGDLPVGGAVITPGGNLSVGFVIHVVVQSAEEAVTAVGLRKALVNGLRRATEWGVTSLALPPLGLGPGNLDPEEGARLLVGVLLEHVGRDEDPRDLTIVVESEYEEDLYLRQVAAAERLVGGS